MYLSSGFLVLTFLKKRIGTLLWVRKVIWLWSKNVFPAKLYCLERDIGNNELRFQQDGTTNTSRMCIRFLRGIFPRLVSWNCDVNWLARFPDLFDLLRFFLWRYLKPKVFDDIRAIDPVVLHRRMHYFRSNLQDCERQQGANLSNIILENKHIWKLQTELCIE